MQLYIDCCFFVLENILSENKRKNDNKRLKLLVDQNNNLLRISYKEDKDLKEQIKNKIKEVINNDNFHLEQVYTLGDEKFNTTGISIIYLGITNEENIKELDNNYKLVDISIIDKKKILFDNIEVEYETKTKKDNNNLEYYHEVKVNDLELEKKIIEIITCYKQIVSKIDYTDIMFKFMPKYFTLEDVRIVYETIKDTSVDKSNFRKKIIKYCKATNKMTSNKGYRPTQLYELVLDEKDIWV